MRNGNPPKVYLRPILQPNCIKANISLVFSMEDLVGWPPNNVRALMQGIANVLAAQDPADAGIRQERTSE